MRAGVSPRNGVSNTIRGGGRGHERGEHELLRTDQGSSSATRCNGPEALELLGDGRNDTGNDEQEPKVRFGSAEGSSETHTPRGD